MGTIKSDVFNFDNESNYLVTIRFDRNGFYVNGHLVTRSDFESVEDSKTPEWPKDGSEWTYPDYFMRHFQNRISVSFGSMEGNTRSYAYYNYIMYHHKL